MPIEEARHMYEMQRVGKETCSENKNNEVAVDTNSKECKCHKCEVKILAYTWKIQPNLMLD